MAVNLTLEQRINAFALLGKSIKKQLNHTAQNADNDSFTTLGDAIEQAFVYNPWFVKENSIFALSTWAELLTKNNLTTWLSKYPDLLNPNPPKRIAVIMAGNIPMVGFHDFLCILLSGNIFLGKLSSDDNKLIPAIAKELCAIEPGFNEMIQFTSEKMSGFDAIIATGSNNSSRYFEYYFSKYEHIIRKNRNGVAVLSGNESEQTLIKLGIDICLYFGLGCRSVSKVFIPEGYDPLKIFSGMEPFAQLMLSHNKHMNNYTYQRSILQMNITPYFDSGFMLLTQSNQYSSAISVINYEFYSDLGILHQKLTNDNEMIQCIVTEIPNIEQTLAPGNTQMPGLSDYADGVDTIDFLVTCNKKI